jgi:hypothetical protein
MLVLSDIENFFPSISSGRVYRTFVDRLGCSPDVAHLLTRLTTLEGSLPQGSPTSTILANLVILPLAWRLDRLASRHCASYGQYVDDVAISGPDHLRRLPPTIKRIITQEGFQPKESKTQAVPSYREQVVTGIRVDHQMGVSSESLEKANSQLDSLISDAECGKVPVHRALWSAEGKVRYISSLNRGAGKVLANRLRNIRAKLGFVNDTKFSLKGP